MIHHNSNAMETAFCYRTIFIYSEQFSWQVNMIAANKTHDDVIKWKMFSRYWSFVRGFHRPTVNSPHKGQWRGAWIFALICARTNGYANNRNAGDLRRHCAHYDVTVMKLYVSHNSPTYVCLYGYHCSGVGVTKAPFVNFSLSKIVDMAKIHVRFFEWRHL